MPNHLQFGPFLLDPDVRALFKGGERLSISSKGFDMLSVLIENRHGIVTKKDLLASLWPDTAVEEANITQNIYSLRKLLGDDPRRHRYIATVPGRGYRFIAPVTELRPDVITGLTPVSPDSSSAGTVALKPVPEQPTAISFRPRSLAWLIAIAIFATLAVTKTFRSSRPAGIGLPELEQQQLTFNSPEDSVASGAISPNGRYLAYADWTGLHVKNIELGTVQKIADSQSAGESPVSWTVAGWLADNDRFVANALVRENSSTLWLAASVGGLLNKLQDDAFGWSISPDASAVAFTRNNFSMDRRIVGGREIWVYDFKTGQAYQLTAAHGRMRYSDPKWAPTGKGLAYIAGGQGLGTLENVIEECDNTGHGCRVAFKGLNLKSFTFLRDGRMVVSKAEPEPNGTSSNLWIKTAESEEQHRITDWQGSYIDGLASSSDGSKLTMRKFSPLGTTYVAELLQNGTQISRPVRFNYNKGQEGPQAWLHDSRTVLLASNRKGHWEILKQALGDQSARPLVDEANSNGRPSVTPDGQWIFYMVGPRFLDATFYRGPVQLMRVPALGGTPVKVMQMRISDDIQCSRNGGHTCVLVQKSEDEKRFIFRSLDPVSGMGPEIASYPIEPAGGYNHALSADGKRIALTRAGSSQIDVLSLDTGAVGHVRTTSRFDGSEIAWTPGDKGFFVSAETSTGLALLEMDLKGKTRILWDQRGATRTWGIPSPDGRLLAILNWTTDSNIWTIQGF